MNKGHPMERRVGSSAFRRNPAKAGTTSGNSRLWLWFVAAFALQAAAWGAWFFIASQHPVSEVPLARIAPNP